MLTADESAYNGLARSPDGRYLAASGDTTNNTMRWDVASGTFVRSFVGHEHVVIKVAFSPDSDELLTGSLLATGSGDLSVRLWDATTGQEVRQLLGHTGAVYAVVFSADGATPLTEANDQTARLWDVQNAITDSGPTCRE